MTKLAPPLLYFRQSRTLIAGAIIISFISLIRQVGSNKRKIQIKYKIQNKDTIWTQCTWAENTRLLLHFFSEWCVFRPNLAICTKKNAYDLSTVVDPFWKLHDNSCGKGHPFELPRYSYDLSRKGFVLRCRYELSSFFLVCCFFHCVFIAFIFVCVFARTVVTYIQ